MQDRRGDEESNAEKERRDEQLDDESHPREPRHWAEAAFEKSRQERHSDKPEQDALHGHREPADRDPEEDRRGRVAGFLHPRPALGRTADEKAQRVEKGGEDPARVARLPGKRILRRNGSRRNRGHVSTSGLRRDYQET